METLGNNLGAKKGQKGHINYYCEKCHFTCCKKYSWERHIETSKHKQEINGSNLETQTGKKGQISDMCCENCNKEFKTRSGLWKHSKTCNFKDKTETNTTSNEVLELKEIMKYLMKENSEMKHMMMAQNTSTQNMMLEQHHMMLDVIKTGTHNTITNTNSHNKTFNLNFYLNETCKNALNISDFVSSIKVSLMDLENTGRQGYIEGISSIILKHLNNLEQYQRPIHCSDYKREIIYIKDNDKWEKECEEKPLLTKAIKVIANENIKKIMEWKENNPDCTNSESKKNNLYLKIVSNSMNGSDKEEGTKNITKIISNVAKETQIQKEN
jgi:hypothetical protein